MAMDITRATIAARYNNERRSNRLASCNKYGFGRVYTNAEIREKVLGDLFPDFAWPGGYPLAYYIVDRYQLTGDVLCADCAREEVIDNRGAVCADAYFEGPDEWCAGCNREIESAYGDPDAEEEEEEEETEETLTADDVAGMWVFNG